jgi:hypothetical protein
MVNSAPQVFFRNTKNVLRPLLRDYARNCARVRGKSTSIVVRSSDYVLKINCVLTTVSGRFFGLPFTRGDSS